MMRIGRRLCSQQGIALIGVLVAVSLLGLLAGLAGSTWKTVMQQARETDLLWKGEQYRRAIASYYELSNAPGVASTIGTSASTNLPGAAGTGKKYPASLNDLIKDPRFTETRRHLRRLYPDPLTGEDWDLVKDPGGRIKGVRSRSELTPFKQDGFSDEQEDFVGKQSYKEWQFIYQPKATAGGSASSGQAGQGGTPSSQAPATPGN